MDKKRPIRVLLIDDHRRIHQAVAEILDFIDDIELVAHGSNGHEAIQLSEEYCPDIVLMDVLMPGMDGITATEAIHKKQPNIKIIALSSFQDEDSVYAMLTCGAVGYILKDTGISDLENTIRVAYEGTSVLSSEITRLLVKRDTRPKSVDSNFGLSEREREVLKHIATGMSITEVAQTLFISQSTVKYHLKNILSKMGVETRAEAIALASKNNLI